MNSAFFLLVDVIPDYVQKTFNLDTEGNPRMGSWIPRTIRMGEKIPDGLDFAVVIYNESLWHFEQARLLVDQIEAANPRVRVLPLPVWG